MAGSLDPDTRYLNGMRGAASFVVFIHHALLPYQSNLIYGYGFEDNKSIFQLPIIRLLYSGNPMVAIFFAVSGYALSCNFFKAKSEHSSNNQYHILSSTLFRRGFRLFLPPLITTSLVMLVVQSGLHLSVDSDQMTGLPTKLPRRFDSFSEQIHDWLHFVLWELTDPFSTFAPVFSYDEHLWTIPVEFRSSVLLYLVLLATARFKSTHQRAILCGLCGYYLFRGEWDVFLFLGGALIANFDILDRRVKASPLLEPKKTTGCKARKSRSYIAEGRYHYWTIFAIGLYCASYPRSMGSETPGFIFMSGITRSSSNWYAFGALFILWSISRDGMLQRLFTSATILSLGDISYSIYLVHGPILELFGDAFVPLVWRLTGNTTTLARQCGLLLAICLQTSLIIPLAGTFHKSIELPLLMLARRLEAFCLET